MVALGIISVIYQERIVEREAPVIQEVPKIVDPLVKDVKEVPKNHAETSGVLVEHPAVANNRVVSDVNEVSAGSMAADTAAPKVVPSADASTSKDNADTNKDLPVAIPQTLEVPALTPAALKSSYVNRSVQTTEKPSYVNRSVQTTEKPSYVNRSVQTTDQPVEIVANTEVRNKIHKISHIAAVVSSEPANVAQLSPEIIEEVPEEDATETPVETVEELPAETNKEAAVGMAEDVHVHHTTKLPLETIVEDSKEIPPKPPVNVEVPEEVTEEPPVGMIEQASEDVSQEAPVIPVSWQ